MTELEQEGTEGTGGSRREQEGTEGNRENEERMHCRPCIWFHPNPQRQQGTPTLALGTCKRDCLSVLKDGEDRMTGSTG